MLDAGFSVIRSLKVLAEDVTNPRMKEIVTDATYEMNAGKQLSDCLKSHPAIFSRLYVAMVEAGEASGNLPSLLLRIADYIENSETMKKKIRASLLYPSIVVAFAVVVVSFIFIFGIPRLETIYAGLGARLPMFTQIIIDTGHFLAHSWIYILPLLLATGAIVARLLRTDRGAFFWDNIKLHSIIFGPLYHKLAIARFASTMGILYSSGVPILHSLKIVATATGNRVIEKVVLDALENIREGQSVVEPLRKSGVFTNMAISMISAGEESGTLGKMLAKVASFYETQVDIALKALAGMIEPIILIFVGILIGCIIIAMALPFMTMGTLLN